MSTALTFSTMQQRGLQPVQGEGKTESIMRSVQRTLFIVLVVIVAFLLPVGVDLPHGR